MKVREFLLKVEMAEDGNRPACLFYVCVYLCSLSMHFSLRKVLVCHRL